MSPALTRRMARSRQREDDQLTQEQTYQRGVHEKQANVENLDRSVETMVASHGFAQNEPLDSSEKNGGGDSTHPHFQTDTAAITYYEMDIDNDCGENSEDELAQNWPITAFNKYETDFVDDPSVGTTIAAVAKTQHSINDDADDFHIGPRQHITGDEKDEGGDKDKLTSHLCYFIGAGECAHCRQSDTPLQHESRGHSLTNDDGEQAIYNSNGNQGQEPTQAVMVPCLELCGVRNRVLTRKASQNARPATLSARNWYLPTGFRPGSDPEATLTASLAAPESKGDPDIGAVFNSMNTERRLLRQFGSNDLLFTEKDEPTVQGSVPPGFRREASPLGSVFGIESEDEPSNDGSPTRESRNDAFYTPQESCRIQDHIHTRIPHLKDHKKCAHCGRDPPRSFVVCDCCKKARYCWKYCQVWDWPIHLFICKRSAEANDEAHRNFVGWAVNTWRGAVGEICKAWANGTCLEDGTCAKVLPQRKSEDTKMRGHLNMLEENSQGRSVQGASPASIFWSRAMSLHLAQGRRFKIGILDK